MTYRTLVCPPFLNLILTLRAGALRKTSDYILAHLFVWLHEPRCVVTTPEGLR